MFTPRVPLEKEHDDIDLENPTKPRDALVLWHDEDKETITIRYHAPINSHIQESLLGNNEYKMNKNSIANDDFIDNLTTLQKQIEECKRPLENHIYQISNCCQSFSQLICGSVSMFTGLGLIISSRNSNDLDNNTIAGFALMGQGFLTAFPTLFGGGFCRYVFPFHKLACFEYFPLNTCDDIGINQIIEATKLANSYFSSIPIADENKDGAEVLRNLNSAVEKINRELKISYKKRGEEVLNALTKYGIFSNNTGPTQTILEYFIPHKSIIESLVPHAPKRK